MKKYLLRIGNLIFKTSPILYRAIYTRYKLYSDAFEIELIKSRVKKGGVVLDVGANIGFYSAFLSDLVGVEGAVYAFEPEAENYCQLAKHATPLGNVKVVNAAVGMSSGEITLYVSKELNVDHHTYDDGTGREAVRSRVVALDDYLESSLKIDFIKMDIQGHELHALNGAKRILTEHSPELLFEFWPYGIRKSGDDPYAVVQFLTDLGYKIDYLCDDKDAAVDYLDSDYDFYFNMHAYKFI